MGRLRRANGRHDAKFRPRRWDSLWQVRTGGRLTPDVDDDATRTTRHGLHDDTGADLAPEVER